jgi:hypothetical protein
MPTEYYVQLGIIAVCVGIMFYFILFLILIFLQTIGNDICVKWFDLEDHGINYNYRDTLVGIFVPLVLGIISYIVVAIFGKLISFVI